MKIPYKRGPEAGRGSSDGEDMAVEALNASLRFGLVILKFLMVGMAVFFALSGMYWINEGNVGVHLRFGEIRGKNGAQVVEPGGPYFALPTPLDRIIRIPTTLRQVAIDESFWYSRRRRSGLKPGEDGSLLTGDHNIVHGKWKATFRIGYDDRTSAGREAPILFARNVGSIEEADRLVQFSVEQAIVEIVAQTSVDSFTRGDLDHERMACIAQQVLDRLQTGISLISVSQSVPPRVPVQVAEDFMAVNKAESEKLRKIEEARRTEQMELNSVAGTGYQKLIEAIDYYEHVLALGDEKDIELADHRIALLLESDGVGGKVADMIGSARTYRTKTVESVRGKADHFAKLLELYERNPRILRDRLRNDTLQKVFTGDVETYYLPPDDNKTIYLEINGDNGALSRANRISPRKSNR